MDGVPQTFPDLLKTLHLSQSTTYVYVTHRNIFFLGFQALGYRKYRI